jgi:hypothetical protein
VRPAFFPCGRYSNQVPLGHHPDMRVDHCRRPANLFSVGERSRGRIVQVHLRRMIRSDGGDRCAAEQGMARSSGRDSDESEFQSRHRRCPRELAVARSDSCQGLKDLRCAGGKNCARPHFFLADVTRIRYDLGIIQTCAQSTVAAPANLCRPQAAWIRGSAAVVAMLREIPLVLLLRSRFLQRRLVAVTWRTRCCCAATS